MNIHVLEQAEDDLVEGYRFYEDQEPGLGNYFLDCLYSDVESLVLYAGMHRFVYKNFHRLLSKRFPFAIYYTLSDDEIEVHAIVDWRKSPTWIRDHLNNAR